MRTLSVLLLTLTCIACSGNQAGIPDQAPDAPTTLTESQYTPISGGLKYHDLKVGTGTEAQKGKHVTVHYTGWLTTGKMFDSSINKKRPFSLTLGSGQVIKGWDEGIVGMRVGGHRQLSIPPNLAYGPDGYAGVIPPSATLIFEIYLTEVK